MKQRDIIVLAVIVYLVTRKKGPQAVGPVTSDVEANTPAQTTAQAARRGARAAQQVDLGPATVTPSTLPGAVERGALTPTGD